MKRLKMKSTVEESHEWLILPLINKFSKNIAGWSD
jgi:hypothetical protein